MAGFPESNKEQTEVLTCPNTPGTGFRAAGEYGKEDVTRCNVMKCALALEVPPGY